jgi:protein-S-isoprenylcysteine O-methyltransferase Ste14
MMSPLSAMQGLWVLWAVSWGLTAAWSSRTEARLRLGSELLHRVPTVVGYILLVFVSARLQGHAIELWTTPGIVRWCLVGVTAAGFAFCWWARIHLGRLWSSSVTRKTDHHIVDTGPYALVRHPIYTGIITASAAAAALEGTLVSLVGLVLVVLGFWLKARFEERFLRAELGAEAYDAYARRTGMLFPRF